MLIVVWDTARGDRVLAHGRAGPITPRLDAFARGAVVFRNAFAPAPWTPPSHASLFTGLPPRRHGVREGRGDGVAPGVPLLAETLRDAGYECAAVVANPFLRSVRRLSAGFDPFIEVVDRSAGKGAGGDVVARVEEFLARRAAAEPARRRPLFLFVNLMESHLRYTFDDGDLVAVHGPGALPAARAAARAVHPHDALAHVLGVREIDAARVAALSDAYDAALHAADRLTGRILDAFDAGAGPHGSLVAVVGDHGENLGERGALDHLLSLSEPVLHVPLIVRRPGGADAGRVVDRQVRLQDLHATVLAAAHLEVRGGRPGDGLPLFDGNLDGRLVVAEFGPPLSLLPVMRGRFPGAPEETFAALRTSLLVVREVAAGRVLRYEARTFHPEGGAPVLLRETLHEPGADGRVDVDLLRGGDEAARATARATARRLRAAAGR